MPCKRASLFIGALLGNLEGCSFAGTFERKEKYIWVPFLDPEAIKILSLGAIWNLVKEQGSPVLILDYGAQRARL
jgi:hypothetical protein